ncbi:MAG: glycosyltransferase [Candidatus Hydrogenedentes bacterium]|nr:glycosyltransferase [Candidatus Hydrogenedentota bacterium]
MPNTIFPQIGRWRLVVYWLSIAMLAAAPVLETPWLRWLGCGIFGAQALSNLGLRALFRANARGLPNLSETSHGSNELPGVTVVVPARNEEDTVEAGVRSLLSLDYPRLEIIAVNDGSTDGTAQILNRSAEDDPRLHVIYDPPLPEGWQGKANAVWVAVGESNPSYPWLLLTDADVRFAPESLRRALAIAVGHELDFLTCIPYLDNQSFWEELLMPATWAGLAIGARPGMLNEPHSAPIGIGPCILVKREVYLQSGGHSAVRNRQPEDSFLAAVVKESGGRMGVALAVDQVQVRIYRGLKPMLEALVTKLRIQQRLQPGCMEIRLAHTLLQEVLPLPLGMVACAAHVASGSTHLSWIAFGAMGIAAYASWAYTISAFRTVAKQRALVEWLHPIGGIIRVALTLRAWRDEIAGVPLTWRDREVSAPEPQNPD